MKAILKRFISISTIVMLILTMIPISSTKGKVHASSTVNRLYVNEDVYYDMSEDIDKLDSEGWFWDVSENKLILSGFDENYLRIDGDVNLVLDGENHIRMDGSMNSGLYVPGDTLYVDSANATIEDKLIVTGEKTGDIIAINTGLASAVINGGSVVVDVKETGTVEAFSFKVFVNNDAVLDVDVTSTEGQALAISKSLTAKGSGNISLRAKGISNTSVSPKKYPTAVNQLFTSEDTTSLITLEAIDPQGGTGAAIRDFQTMELGVGGCVDIISGAVFEISDYEYLAPNIKVTPEDYILQLVDGYDDSHTLKNSSGNVIADGMTFEAQIEDVPMTFVDGAVWDIPEGEVNKRIKNIDISGGFGLRDRSGITFKITEGTLPAGISLSEEGIIRGTYREITSAGQITVTVYYNDVLMDAIDPFIINYGKVIGERFYFTLDDKQYDDALDHSGENWSYDASSRILTLDNYTGRYMSFPSDIDIELIGENNFIPEAGQSNMIQSDGTVRFFTSQKGILNITGDVSDTSMTVLSGNVILDEGVFLNGELTGKINLFATKLTADSGSSVNINIDSDWISPRAINSLYVYGNSNVNIKVNNTFNMGTAEGISTLRAYNYSGEMKVNVQVSEDIEPIAIGNIGTLDITSGGVITVERGYVELYLSSTDISDNVEIFPTDCYVTPKKTSNWETIADASGNPLDGGISFIGQDEDFFEYRKNPEARMSGMVMDGTYYDYELRYGQMGKGYGEYEYVIAEGALPAGLNLDKKGRITGILEELSEAGTVIIDIYRSGIKVDSFELAYDAVEKLGYYFKINGDEYYAKNDVSGEGWHYDAELNQLTLEGYDGGRIETKETLNLKIKGKNIITIDNVGPYYNAIHVRGKLIINKDSSDETDVLIIRNDENIDSAIDGVYTSGGTVLNGGTLKFEMSGAVSPVAYAQSSNIAVNNGANLYVDIMSETRELKAVPGNLTANGSGTIDINITCIQQNNGVRYGIKSLTVNEGCTSVITVNYDVTEGEDGFAISTISNIDFGKGGKLEILKGGVGLANGSISKNVHVTPADYNLKPYDLGGSYTVFNTMYDSDGNWITEGISFENTGTVPEYNITLSDDFIISQLQQYDKINTVNISDAFNDYGGRDLGLITYEIAEGQLPEGLELTDNGNVKGYGMKITDPGSIKVRLLSDGEYIEGLDTFEIKYAGVIPCQYPPDVYLGVDKDVLEVGDKVYLQRGHTGLPSRDTYRADVTVTSLNPDIVDFDDWITAKSPGKADFKGVSEREDVEDGYLSVYVKEPKPAGYYQDGYIRGLDPDSAYSINGDERFTDDEGKLPVEESWKNRRNKIIKLSEWEQCYSTQQVLGIVSEDSIILSDEEVVYSGSAIEPDVDVVVNGDTLIEGTDYTVEYSNNINPGTATVEVTGKGSYSGKAFKSFSIKPPDLSKPASVTAELYGYNDVKVKWSAVKGATCYYIYYKKGSWNGYKYYGKSVKTTRNIPNLMDGSKYYFRIYPCVEIDGVIYKDFSYKTSKQIFTLKKVNKPTVKKVSKKYVKVSWNNINGESGYQIARSKFKNKNFIIVKNVGKLYKSTKVKPPKKIKYYYKVRAYKTVNGKKIFGPWSKATGYKL